VEKVRLEWKRVNRTGERNDEWNEKRMKEKRTIRTRLHSMLRDRPACEKTRR